MSPTPTIAARDASVRLGGRDIWAGLSVTVEPGQFVAVLGPNGAGKSTFLRAVLGLQPLASGSLEVLGTTPRDARGGIGYLPQRRSFDATLRIRGVDMVRLGLDGHRWGTPLLFARRISARHRAQEAAVDAAIERVGATAYAHRAIGESSGGEQQRLLIAQALIRHPDLLLLDEPLDSLDLPNQQAIASLIRSICASGVSAVMVAHDVNPILGYLDQVVFVASGRALAGAPADVITSENLSRLYDTAIEVVRTPSGRLVVVGAPDTASFHSHGAHEH